MTTAAGIIIGDEILSGKVQDTNAPALIHTLHDVGVELVRISTIGDDPTCIAEEVNLCRQRCDYVITSGGVGPTHDDRTIEGIARAFDCAVVRHPRLEQAIRDHWGDRLNDAALKLAEVPEGASLLLSDDGLLPVVTMENVYVLPGIPQLFELKLQRVRSQLTGQISVLHSLYVSADESSIAQWLAQVDRDLPEVKIGSYPRMDEADHRVRITVESTRQEVADEALERLLHLLPPERVVRVKRGE